jgi:ubiquinone biosynthesis protein
MALIAFTRAVRSIASVRRVAVVLGKYGFGPTLRRLGVQRSEGVSEAYRDAPMPKRLRAALEELGPTYVKLGQTLSMRPDLIAPEFIAEFKQLQDNVRPISAQEVRQVIEDAFGAAPEDLYESFELEPLAAASIGQVHRAVLRGADDEPIDVVVKVRRPGIRQIVDGDLRALSLLADALVKYIPETRAFNPVGLVEEFFRTITRELDFREEASSLKEVAGFFADAEEQFLVIPTVFPHLTGETVLTMSLLDGVPLSDETRIRALPCDLKEVAVKGGIHVLDMIFKYGVFHGDLHSGNVFVFEDGRLGLIDFGIVGRLDERAREQVADLLLCLVNGDFHRAARTYADIGNPVDAERPMDVDQFGRKLGILWSPVRTRPLSEVNVGQILLESAASAARANIMLPQDLMLLFKGVLTMEHMGHTLDPEFDVTGTLRGYMGTLLAQRLDPTRLQRELLGTSMDLYHLGREAPELVLRSLRRIGDGSLAVDINVRRSKQLIDVVSMSSNRLASAVVTAGLSVASAILIAVDTQPFASAFSYLGLLGILLAGFWGTGLLISMARNPKG